MSKIKSEPRVKKKTVVTRKNHDGSDEPLPGRTPSEAFVTALNAVRATPKKAKK
jgi:hypothetical protein